jgi:uncharacterized protein
MITLKEQDLYDIVQGASFLASGGGGGWEQGKTIVKEIVKILAQYHLDGVELKSVKEVGGNEWGAVAAGIGSPDAAAIENIAEATYGAFEGLASELGKVFNYTLSAETGSGNIALAMLTAVKPITENKSPLYIVDGDGSGRAVPEVEMSTYASVLGTDIPIVLTSGQYQKNGQYEQTVKTILQTKGSSISLQQQIDGILGSGQFNEDAGIAIWAMDGETLKRQKNPPIISGTITRALQLGRKIREATETGKDPVEEVLNFLNKGCLFGLKCRAFKLFEGTIEQVTEETEGGFDLGTVTLKNGDREVYIINKNENLIAWDKNKLQPLAIAPDLICYLTPDGKTWTNGDNLKDKVGQKLVLIGVKAEEVLRQGLIFQAFQNVLQEVGYYGTYMPIEVLYYSNFGFGSQYTKYQAEMQKQQHNPIEYLELLREELNCHIETIKSQYQSE